MSLANLNPFAISGLLIVIAYLPLFILISLKGKSALSRVFAMYALSVLLWGFGSLLAGINKNPNHSINIWKFAYVSVPFIPVFFYHSVMLLRKKINFTILFLIYTQAFAILVLTLSNSIFGSTRLVFSEYYSTRGNIIYLTSFILWIIIVSFAHLSFFQYYHKIFPNQKKQIFFIIIATCIGFAGSITNFFPQLGIDVYPYGNFLIPFHAIAIAYAILKYKILDIEIAIRKSAVYSILIATITLAYLIIIFLFEKLLQGVVGYKSLFISIIAAFGIGLIFIPLRNKIQYLIDNIFFKGSHEEIARQNELLREQVARTERLKSVATLASGIAHEVKNPLQAVKTFAEFLPQKMDDKEFLNKFSNIVGKEVGRIDNLVHQLLDFAKPNPLTLNKVSLNELLCDTLDLLNSHFIKCNIQISKNFDRSSNPIFILADLNKLRQAVLNILLNAIEAMPTGGTLTVNVSSHEQRTTIHASDTGSGIPKKDLSHIFDPFYTTKDHGTGLGLSITQRIIQEHNGKIFIESEPGKGTTVRIEMGIWEEKKENEL